MRPESYTRDRSKLRLRRMILLGLPGCAGYNRMLWWDILA